MIYELKKKQTHIIIRIFESLNLMSMSSVSEIIFNQTPIIITCLGVIGNLLGLISFTSPSFKKLRIGPRYIYVFLFIVDSITLINLIFIYLTNTLQLSLIMTTVFSSNICKLYRYLYPALNDVSPYLLVYISVDRLVAIKFNQNRLMLRKAKVQITYFVLLVSFQFLYYLPRYFLYENQNYASFLANRNLVNLTVLSKNNITIKNTVCEPRDLTSQYVVSSAGFFLRTVIPFVSMLIISCILIHNVIQIRNRITHEIENAEIRNFKRDLKFSITSIFLNIFYVCLTIPVTVTIFQLNYYDNFRMTLITGYVYYLNHSLNFYIIMATNSMLRRVILRMVFKKGLGNNQQTSGQETQLQNIDKTI